MSIAKLAARGVAWNMLFGVGSRVLQLVGTLVLTRFIAPEAYGAVLGASIAILTAGLSTSFAFGQYLITNRPPARVAFQATVVHVLLGIVTVLIVVVLRSPIAGLFGAPTIAAFIPGFAVAHVLDRVRYVPERILTRELRYRTIATINGGAEILFTIAALLLVRWCGAYAILIAAIIRSTFATTLFLVLAPRDQWLAPTRLDRGTVSSLLGYGTPIMLTSISDHAASRFDSIVISAIFGPGIMACYNLAYSMAEMPVNNVAGNIAEVLMPSYSRLSDADRWPAVLKSAALLTLVVAPLGVGLGAVAPTLVRTFFTDKWALMGPMLVVLSVMTVFRPMYWPALAYLQAMRQNHIAMYLSIARAVLIVSLVAVLGWFGGPLWACLGAGIGYAAHSAICIFVTGVVTKHGSGPYFAAIIRPLIVCVPMFVVAWGIGFWMRDSALPGPAVLALQVIFGAIVYGIAAMFIARPSMQTLLNLAMDAVGRRRFVPNSGVG